MEISEHQTYSTRCPFLKSSWNDGDYDGNLDYRETWIPGTRWEQDGDDLLKCADGEGIVRYTVKQIVPVKGYATRVFYTTTYVDPEGKGFGKNRLKIATATVFKRYVAAPSDYVINDNDFILPFEDAENA